MARARRQYSNLEAEIYRRLNEVKGSSRWSATEVLDAFNEAKDLREMQMNETYEGWNLQAYTVDLVANQEYYQIPEDVGRIASVRRQFSDGSLSVPLRRYEGQSMGVDKTLTISGDSYLPVYRLVGEQILLMPPPTEAVTAGLRVEFEEITERFTAATDTIALSWPLFIETLLVLDTVLILLGHEELEEPGQVAIKRVERNRDRYAFQFDNYIESRNQGLILSERHSLGA